MFQRLSTLFFLSPWLAPVPPARRSKAGLSRQRCGISVMELIAAMVLLSAALAMVTIVSRRIADQCRTSDWRERLAWEALNMEQRLRGLPPDQITAESIESVPVHGWLNIAPDAARWHAEVTEINVPVRCLRITLQLTGRRQDVPWTSSPYTFWIPLEAPRVPHP
ncbi:MAG: hypothetical protein KatS3mg111_1632 [Pirellulaceae bacterium]|nr:MAG: hypothetical protein KatS3mg111_1632 [Pirellulaceae bacterium]